MKAFVAKQTTRFQHDDRYILQHRLGSCFFKRVQFVLYEGHKLAIVQAEEQISFGRNALKRLTATHAMR